MGFVLRRSRVTLKFSSPVEHTHHSAPNAIKVRFAVWCGFTRRSVLNFKDHQLRAYATMFWDGTGGQGVGEERRVSYNNLSFRWVCFKVRRCATFNVEGFKVWLQCGTIRSGRSTGFKFGFWLGQCQWKFCYANLAYYLLLLTLL